ncbi:MAG: hypothetical protein HKN09_07340 [Saprospiraceae bacterium]|nr:hypothetical protein [Saprospiraceae bacterium]
MLNYLKNTNTFIRYRYWEYWPVWLAYLPVIPVILFYALVTRRLFFFSNVNPVFKTGALMGASKFKILSQIPDKYKPKTILNTKQPNRIEIALDDIRKAQIEFPLIVKPNIGERAVLVELIHDEDELEKYIRANDIDILIQEFISLPNECGIFYIRKPSESKGKVVSIGLKNFFKLKGDGKSTVRRLMELNPRYKLQIERFEDQGNYDVLNRVLALNEEFKVEPIGNHNRGTTFIDGNHLICKEVDALFDKINASMDQVYYGRFDVKYNTWEELKKGVNIRILEMNGVASEPIHIYDASVPLKDKYKSFYRLWHTIFQISRIQKSRGIHPIRSTAAIKAYREYKGYMKSLNANWRQAHRSELSIG